MPASQTAKGSTACMQFLTRMSNKAMPPNLVVVLDTHADGWSGFLQHAGITNPKVASIREVLDAHIPRGVLAHMKEASNNARSDKKIESLCELWLREPWAPIGSRVRGGWRILVVASCGTSVKQPVHWMELCALVDQ
jgi:hypothetical protein